MTPRHRRAVLAKIHLAVQQLGWSDDQYRDALWAQFGETVPARSELWRSTQASAKHLTATELDDFVRFLRGKGFVDRHPARATKRRPPERQPESKEALLGKIEALLAEAGRPWAYAHAMAKHMFRVDQVQWCDYEQLRKIVAALSINARRQGRAEG